MDEFSKLKETRIALLTNIPRPYRTALFEALNKKIGTLGGKFHVFFYSNIQKHERRRGVENENGYYPNVQLKSLEFSLDYERVLSIPISLFAALNQFDPDLLISGTFGFPGLLGWVYTRQKQIPYVQWSGATSKSIKTGITPYLHSLLARHADACVTYGTAARDYLVEYGVSPQKIVIGVNAIDTQYFFREASQSGAEVDRIKSSQQFTGCNLLYVGSLVPRKGHSLFLKAVSRLEKKEIHIHFVGGGPLQGLLRQQTIQLGLEEHVHFWGQQPPSKIPLFYALADVFVFPTLDDVWGLVLNEAMACNLPVIASTIAGATQDLVVDGENGFVVDPHNVERFAETLNRLLIDVTLRHKMGCKARATINAKATIQHSAQAFMEAIQLAFEMR